MGVQQATPSQLDRRLRDVTPEELIRRPAPEKWSIAEIVAHLADAELAMGWRLRNMLANPGVALTWWDKAVWAEHLGYVAARGEPFGRSLSGAARERPAAVGVGPARTVGGVLSGSTRYADGKRSRSSSAWKRRTT